MKSSQSAIAFTGRCLVMALNMNIPLLPGSHRGWLSTLNCNLWPPSHDRLTFHDGPRYTASEWAAEKTPTLSVPLLFRDV
jgi:hypothetical protein